MVKSIHSRMLTKKISIPTHTTILPNKAIKLCGLKHELEQLSFGDCKESTLVFLTGGKGFLVMNANSAMFSLLSLLSNITFFLFSLLLLSTHYSDFLHIIFLDLCVLVLHSIFMGTVPIYTITQPMLFSIFTLFTNHFVYCRHSVNTHSVLATTF